MKVSALLIHAAQSARLLRCSLPAVAALLALAPSLVTNVAAQTITSAVPGYISYQGKFTNASGAVVGAGAPVNRLVIFRVWSHQSNSTVGELLYSEQQTVAISEGEFSVLIGAGTAVTGTPLGYSEAAKGPPTVTLASAGVFGGVNRYLGVTVDDGSAAADPELSPRQQIVASAYALRARYAEALGSNGASTIMALDNGNVGIGAANPGTKLEVAGNIRAGGAGIASPAISLLANSASAVALTAGYANAAGVLSTDAAAGDTVLRTDNSGKLLIQSGTGGAALTINSANKVGIGEPNPGFPLTFASTLGDKISLYGNSGSHFGFGIQGSLLQIHGDLSTSDIAFGYGSSGSLTELMRIKGTGNVGIGTTSPTAKLDVSGSVRASGASGFVFSGGGDTDGGLFSPADGTVTVRTNNAERLRVDSSGNVGIGNAAPIAPISLASTLGQKITLYGASTSSTYGLGVQSSLLQIHTDLSTSDIAFGYGSSSSFTEIMRVRGNGNVGLGSTAATQAKLVVNGSATGSTGMANSRYFNVGSGSSILLGGNDGMALSIWASQVIAANGFFAYSDARTKRSEGRSDSARDLSTLLGIEVTDYRYVDAVAKGSRPQKKVIAQQVEKIFPQAVSKSTDVVPDIYRQAKFKDGWIHLATDLKAGDRVRLIAEKKEGIHDVLEVAEGRFRTDFAATGDQVFVYGREVNDFRSVDYEAIAMLNVSATQEIKREKDIEIAALRAGNAGLRQQIAEQARRIAELEAKDHARDARLAAIERLFSSGQTVMARPASTTTNGGGQD